MNTLTAALANFVRRAALPLLLPAGLLMSGAARADLPATIDAIRPSLVVVGMFRPTASPRFGLGGAGFAVGNGNLVITNAHVIEPGSQDPALASLAVQIRVSKTELQMRAASVVEVDSVHDLALLRIEGSPLPALRIGESDAVREGQAIAFMGFPIGGVLGFSAVTHRGIIASITPIALPSPNARRLNEVNIQRMRDGVFDIFQLDATSYPGNSGGPVFDPETGRVLGVLNMAFVKGSKESALSQPSGISYAIPSRFIVPLLQKHAP